jgi:hypothetical protein
MQGGWGRGEGVAGFQSMSPVVYLEPKYFRDLIHFLPRDIRNRPVGPVEDLIQRRRRVDWIYLQKFPGFSLKNLGNVPGFSARAVRTVHS